MEFQQQSGPATAAAASRAEAGPPADFAFGMSAAPHASFQREGDLQLPAALHQGHHTGFLIPTQPQARLHFQQQLHSSLSGGPAGHSVRSQPPDQAPRSAANDIQLDSQRQPEAAQQASVPQNASHLQFVQRAHNLLAQRSLPEPEPHAQLQQMQPQQQQPPQEPSQVPGHRDNFGLVLPLSRIKKMIKQEGNVKAVSAEASYAVTKATEMLVETLAVKASAHMYAGTRSVMIYKDVATAVKEWPAADFLSDIVPETITIGELRQLLAKQQQEKAMAAANGSEDGDDSEDEA